MVVVQVLPTVMIVTDKDFLVFPMVVVVEEDLITVVLVRLVQVLIHMLVETPPTTALAPVAVAQQLLVEIHQVDLLGVLEVLV